MGMEQSKVGCPAPPFRTRPIRNLYTPGAPLLGLVRVSGWKRWLLACLALVLGVSAPAQAWPDEPSIGDDGNPWAPPTPTVPPPPQPPSTQTPRPHDGSPQVHDEAKPKPAAPVPGERPPVPPLSKPSLPQTPASRLLRSAVLASDTGASVVEEASDAVPPAPDRKVQSACGDRFPYGASVDPAVLRRVPSYVPSLGLGRSADASGTEGAGPCFVGLPAPIVRPNGVASAGASGLGGWAWMPGALLASVALGIVGLAIQLGWLFFSRLTGDHALHHPRRAQMLEFVRSNPGQELTALARALGLARPIARYHAERLAALGLITFKRFSGRTSLFAADVGCPRHLEAVALLRREPVQRVYEVLRAGGPLSQVDVARRVALTQQRVSQLLARMLAARLAVAVANGGRRHYHAADLPIAAQAN